MIATALTVNHREACITNAALILDIEVTVGGADVRGHALALVESSTVVAMALTVDVGLVRGADRVAETVGLLEARLAQALIRVAIVVVSRRTHSANSLNAHVL